MKAEVWFVNSGTGYLVGDAESPYVPRVGEIVQIRVQDWRVLEVYWALDNVDDPMRKRLRAIVELGKIESGGEGT